MNNREAVIATLVRHREARQWTDEAVADDLLGQLDLKPDGDAPKAHALVDPSLIGEDEVVAHETAAKLAAEKAKESRDRLNAQKADEAKAKAVEAVDQAKTAVDAARPAGPTPQQVAERERVAAEATERQRVANVEAAQRAEAARVQAAQAANQPASQG